MCSDATVGWDLGGAHLKAAMLDAQGKVTLALQLPCPLWQGLNHLSVAIDSVLSRLPATRTQHAVTMTGELADLFANRREGVERLIEIFCRTVTAEHTRVYAGEAGFIAPNQSPTHCEQIASANWMATGAFLATRVPEALLIDVGSTTTDLVTVKQAILAHGRNDRQRLLHGELIYSGVVRTALMAVVERVPFAGEWLPVMAEQFATTADVYRLTGELSADADQMPSADGKGKSLPESARRLARMLGCDLEVAPLGAWQRCAAYIAEAQLSRISEACHRVLSRGILQDHAPLIGAGVGRFLVAKLARRMQRPYLDFASFIDSDDCAARWSAHCAPSVAVAALLQAQHASFTATAGLGLGRTSCG